ncbi:MAG: alpha-ketoglutarate-dependent dioxygenase AlkB [Acidobacteriota bacterium]
MAVPQPLFDTFVPPEGFRAQPEFLQPAEETDLAERFQALEFHEMRMRGVTARRRILQYGWRYGFESVRVTEGEPLPDFLFPVRDRAAAFAGLASAALSEALLTEYSPGAPIGWHRDAPPFGDVIGISLLSACRFRFRRGRTGAWENTELPLAPRSIYVMTGAARTEWEHSIPGVAALRYSITFRTLRLQPRV